MAMAASALVQRRIKRVILCRPAVEAGERLGFLPGDLAEKVNPYLRPLYDALHDMLDYERVEQLRERGQIEVAPLAFMRGRTLNDSFVILDEAQNATSDQMRMFLTRLGFEHAHLIAGRVLRLVQNHERVIERPPAHESQRGHFDLPPLAQLLDALIVEHVVQGIVERPEVWIHLFRQVAGEKSKPLARF